MLNNLTLISAGQQGEILEHSCVFNRQMQTSCCESRPNCGAKPGAYLWPLCCSWRSIQREQTSQTLMKVVTNFIEFVRVPVIERIFVLTKLAILLPAFSARSKGAMVDWDQPVAAKRKFGGSGAISTLDQPQSLTFQTVLDQSRHENIGKGPCLL